MEAKRLAAQERAKQSLTAAPASVAEIAHYLQFISASAGRDKWLPVILAIHNATKGSEEGRALAHSWSAGCPRQYNPEDLDANIWDWASENERDGKGYTMGTIVHHAKAHAGFKRYQPRLTLIRHVHADEYQAMLDAELLK